MLNNPIIHIEDGFFQDGMKVRRDILGTSFQDVTSPVDLVTYPDINFSIPNSIKQEFLNKIEDLVGKKINSRFLFARAMIEGRPVPHKVHSDFNMGTFSAHVYLSLDWPKGSGTSFFRHETQGILGTAKTDWTQVNHNSMDAWTKYLHCEAKFNRILIHDSEYWHMAEPHNAWGNRPENGRLVLTCFFDIGGTK